MLNRINVLLAAACALALLLPGSAMAEPIGAKVVYIEGKASVVHMDGKEARLKMGDPLTEGDTVKTAADGALEIEYDNKDLTRVDKNTTMVIKSLNRSSGSSFSIFGLMAGRIKSSVSKLISKESKFEYHTKSAVAGVAGTPPFIIEVEGDITNVDLLGAEGEPGSVYVQGTDIKKTMVMLMSGQRTSSRFGQPPLTPFGIDPARFQNLQRLLPFISRGQSTGGPQEKKVVRTGQPAGEKEPEDKPGQGGGGGGAGGGGMNLVVNNISGGISTIIQPGPSGMGDPSKLNMSTTAKQGSIGSDAGAGVETDQPPPFATGNVSLTFK